MCKRAASVLLFPYGTNPPQTPNARAETSSVESEHKPEACPVSFHQGWLSLSALDEDAVTSLATSVVRASPTLLPIWEMVWKTPPARPCVFTGSMEVISKLEMVKTSSAAMGFSTIAGKANASMWLLA